MTRPTLFTLLALTPLLICACAKVERRIIINSEPQGARVFLNDTDVGVTPTEVDFTWFGVYDIRLHKPGYEPLVTKRKAKAPLHEQPVFDLVALALPTDKSTIIQWHFDLEPASVDTETLLLRAAELRDQTNEAPAPIDADASASSPSDGS